MLYPATQSVRMVGHKLHGSHPKILHVYTDDTVTNYITGRSPNTQHLLSSIISCCISYVASGATTDTV
jgi:hypothetical protein